MSGTETGQNLVTVGVAQLAVSANAADVLITYALGSCIALLVWDPVARVGGLLHALLPRPSRPEERDKDPASTYVDSGVPMLFKQCYEAGAKKERMVVKAVGGAHLDAAGSNMFQIGKRNVSMLRKLLWKNGVMLDAEDLEGTDSRTVSLAIASGEVVLKVDGEARVL
ncbi:MAG: chemotaxis protein CheD [Planctomycetes bacterium]|nr:chemotaxis protein CheD [Planctomycetota bacterium]